MMKSGYENVLTETDDDFKRPENAALSDAPVYEPLHNYPSEDTIKHSGKGKDDVIPTRWNEFEDLISEEGDWVGGNRSEADVLKQIEEAL